MVQVYLPDRQTMAARSEELLFVIKNVCHAKHVTSEFQTNNSCHGNSNLNNLTYQVFLLDGMLCETNLGDTFSNCRLIGVLYVLDGINLDI